MSGLCASHSRISGSADAFGHNVQTRIIRLGAHLLARIQADDFAPVHDIGERDYTFRTSRPSLRARAFEGASWTVIHLPLAYDPSGVSKNYPSPLTFSGMEPCCGCCDETARVARERLPLPAPQRLGPDVWSRCVPGGSSSPRRVSGSLDRRVQGARERLGLSRAKSTPVPSTVRGVRRSEFRVEMFDSPAAGYAAFHEEARAGASS